MDRTHRAGWTTAFAPAGAIALAAVLGIGVVSLGDDAVSVRDVRRIALDTGTPVSLSPDGALLVTVGPIGEPLRTRVCVHDVATLAVVACSDPTIPGAGVHPGGIAWSPDGRHLAFAEDQPGSGMDGDLWLMDASTGVLTNLDDDGYTGQAMPGIILPDQAISLPMAPAFAPDGSAVAYGRQVAEEGRIVREEVVSVAADGGAADVLLTLPGATSGATSFGMRWAPDGSRLFITSHSDALRADDGIVSVAQDGSDLRLELGTTNVSAGSPAVAVVSSDGRHLLVHHPRLAAAYAGQVDAWSLVDLETGAATTIESQDPMLSLYAFVGLAGFSPDGRWLLTVTRGSEPDGQVFVRSTDGATPELALVPEGLGRSGSIRAGMPVSWASNGSVLIPAGPGSGEASLLTLAGGARP